MKKNIYPKLAWTAIRKNKQLYVPYLIAGIVMVMVFYILSLLSFSDVVASLKGGSVMIVLIRYAAVGVGIFSVPFLFYTNSTLIKKRKKELGLYNILGMNKKNIFFVLVWETLMAFGITVGGGLFSGSILSKIAELGLLNIMGEEINYRVYVDRKSSGISFLVFAFIYVLILINTLCQIHNSNPIKLLQSENMGERPPKGNWLLALVSVAFLTTGYYITNTLENGQDALNKIPLVIVAVIVGTYLFFLCFSVFVCRALQKNKHYYYQTAHFVTVSSMTYRMKRSGASLASICVLVTAILVMLTTTVSFYAGVKNIVAVHYPYDMAVTAYVPNYELSEELTSHSITIPIQDKINQTFQKQNVTSDKKELYSAGVLGLIRNGKLDFSDDTRSYTNIGGSFTDDKHKELNEGEKIVFVQMISLADYNKWCNSSEVLDSGIMLGFANTEFDIDSIILPDNTAIHIEKTTIDVPLSTGYTVGGALIDNSNVAGYLWVCVPDLNEFLLNQYKTDIYTNENHLTYRYEYDSYLQNDYDRIDDICSNLRNTLGITENDEDSDIIVYSHAEKVDKAKGVAGGLMFIMIILNIVCAFVTTLIMYYKQISEGFEDSKRFAIMRKIGMTTREIKQSINSQMLTVFGIPLIVAGVHLIFTTELIHQILCMVLMNDKPLLIKVTAISFVLFVFVYAFVYMLTSRTYFKIVNASSKNVFDM